MNLIKSAFRYDINALRAIAVISVLCYHYQFSFLKGGFAGVDIFFVISGYLMSKIILTALEKQTFSYPAFLLRRIERIIPALLFLIILITVTGFLIYFPWDFKTSTINALGSLLFYSNFLYLPASAYFDASSALNTYLHTWSLSVEFQFYLIYPFILISLNAISKKKHWLIIIISLLSAVLFTFSVLLTHVKPVWSFYLLPSRAWEMLVGGMVFLLGDLPLTKLVRQIAAVGGYLILLISLVLLNSWLPWPGFYTLIPVLSTSLIIIAGLNDGFILKNRVIQYIGKISYSLYLWHWPIYVYSQYMGFGNSLTIKFLLITLSFMLATLSYIFVEQTRVTYKKLLVASLSIVAALIVCTEFQINSLVFKNRSLDIARYKSRHMVERNQQFSEGKCFISKGKFEDFNKSLCLHIESGKKNYLLIGDSHGAELSQSLRQTFAARGINLIQATSSGCLPLLRNYGLGHCTRLIDYIYHNFIPQNQLDIDGIILSANWARGHYDRIVLLDDITNTLTYLKQYHFKVIMLGQTEVYTIPYPYIAAREVQYQLKSSKNYLDQEADAINKMLQTSFPGYYVPVYSSDSPPLKSGTIPYFFDENHLTGYGADLKIAKFLTHRLTKKFFSLQ